MFLECGADIKWNSKEVWKWIPNKPSNFVSNGSRTKMDESYSVVHYTFPAAAQAPCVWFHWCSRWPPCLRDNPTKNPHVKPRAQTVTYMSHFAPYPQKGQPRSSSGDNEEIRLNLRSKKQISENWTSTDLGFSLKTPESCCTRLIINPFLLRSHY